MPPVNVTYTSRDYTSIYEWLLTILREECPEYTDLNHSDAGIALIRLIARISDSLSLYLDMAFAEAFVSSAKFKQSLIEIARTVDLLPKLPSAASTTVRFTRKMDRLGNVEVNGSYTGAIFIPRYTEIFAYDGTPFFIDSDVNIARGETYKDVIAIQGVHETLTLSRSDFFYDSKTGRYLYNLGANIADGYLTMVENELIAWENVDSFWRSFSTDTHFILESYADKVNGIADTIYLIVGNGTQGATLSSSSTYVLDYVRCNAADGNMAPNLVINIDDDYTPFVSLANIVVSSGGAGVETIEDYRIRIPKVVRTQRRAVTKEDYEALIISIPGIKRVQAIDRNENGIYPWEYVGIYAVPEGGGNLSNTLMASILDTCKEYGALGGWYRRYIIKSVTYDSINVTCSVGAAYGIDPNTLISSVTAAINSFFHVDNNDISKVFVIGELHSAVMAVSGVSWVEFPNLDYTYAPDYGHMTSLGSLVVNVI